MITHRLAAGWIALALALVFVGGSGAWITRTFYLHNFLPCRGKLVQVSPVELGHGEHVAVTRADLDITYDVEPKNYPTVYKNARVVWVRQDARSCSDIAIEPPDLRHHPTLFDVERESETGLYLVLDAKTSTPKIPLAVFRKIESSGRRYAGHLVDPHNLSMLIFMIACGALAFGAFRTLQATPYGRRMHRWRPATLNDNGAVESETGEMLGRMERPLSAGDVIVDPAALEGGAYRSVAVLTRKTVGAGTHERWTAGTLRQLRDARSLTVIACLTTAIAIAAHLIEG